MVRVSNPPPAEPPGTVVTVAGIPTVLVGTTRTNPGLPYTYTVAGPLTVQTGLGELYNDTGRPLTISVVRGSVGVAPTGAAVILEIKKNGVPITDTANRVTIAAGTQTDTTTVFTHPVWNNGEYLTVDILQVGSTVAGSVLVTTITAS